MKGLVILTVFTLSCGSGKKEEQTNSQDATDGDASRFMGLWEVRSHLESNEGCEEPSRVPFLNLAAFRIQPMSNIIPNAVGFSFLECKTIDDCPKDTIGISSWELQKMSGDAFVGESKSSSHGGTSKLCYANVARSEATLADDDSMKIFRKNFSGQFEFVDESECDPESRAYGKVVAKFECSDAEEVVARRVDD